MVLQQRPTGVPVFPCVCPEQQVPCGLNVYIAHVLQLENHMEASSSAQNDANLQSPKVGQKHKRTTQTSTPGTRATE